MKNYRKPFSRKRHSPPAKLNKRELFELRLIREQISKAMRSAASTVFEK